MPEQIVQVPTRDGEAPSWLYTPEGPPFGDKGPWPGVVYYTDIWGVRDANQKMARRVAAQGYAVLQPHLFYRTHTLPVDPLVRGEPRSPDMVQALLASLNAQQQTEDGIAYVEYLLGREDVKKPLAVVGYCFSGAMALRTAAAMPDKVIAAASFHGGGLVTDKPDSPHTLIPNVKAELYFGHAVEDQSATPQQIARLDDALKGWGGTYTSEVYQGALHGWTVEGRPEIYNPAQAERHFEKLFDLLKRNLKL